VTSPSMAIRDAFSSCCSRISRAWATAWPRTGDATKFVQG
jgi:hypothetical protein